MNNRQTEGLLPTGAFARKAGVTVRTLRYYDRLGLVRPGARTPSGHRLYGTEALVRLQQVLTLHFIGFPLREIRRILDAPDYDLSTALARQRRVIAEKARQTEAVLAAIDGAIKAVASCPVDWERFAGVIREVQMEKQGDFFRKYYSEDAMKFLETRAKDYTPEQAKKDADAWGDVFKDIQRLADAGADPGGKEAQSVAARARDLISRFTEGRPEVESGLKKLVADRDNLPAPQQGWYSGLNERGWAFYSKVMSCQPGGDDSQEKQG